MGRLLLPVGSLASRKTMLIFSNVLEEFYRGCSGVVDEKCA